MMRVISIQKILLVKKMKRIKITICFLAVVMVNSALAAVRHVPEEYDTIQAAINACKDFDTVVIAAGRYSGPGNRDIKFNGKPITVRSTDPTDPRVVNSTIIDCEGKGRGFVFYMGENADSTIAGLTITNGYALLGGGVYCYNNSGPSIKNCIFISNSAVLGGAIASANSKSCPTITNCLITANSALAGGGGIYLNGASPTIANCVINGNTAPEGGAIYSHNIGNPVISGCTVSQNTASVSAAGIYCYKASNVTINNSILWGNSAAHAPEILVGNLGAATSIRISYCDIQDRDESVIYDSGCTVNWGEGNIDIDPDFVETADLSSSEIFTGSDHHLIKDSPCVDAGDPGFIAGPDETDIDGNPRILGMKIDIGADEFEFPLPAVVKVTPKTLNPASRGRWISCTIWPPDNYDVGDIDAASITLNGKIEPVWSRIDRRAQNLLVKFDRAEAQNMLNAAQGSVSLSITGKLSNGKKFEGADTTGIVRTGGKG